MHCVGLVILISNPVVSSLKDNCTVLGVKLEAPQILIAWPIADLDLGDLSLWLLDIQAAPIVFESSSGTTSAVSQNELILAVEYFINSDQLVVVVELIDRREVSVLLAVFEWHVRITESALEFVSIAHDTYLKVSLQKQRFCEIVLLNYDHLLLAALNTS
jgi:hypothetical protein